MPIAGPEEYRSKLRIADVMRGREARDLGGTRRQVVLLQRFADLVERSRVTDDVKGVPRPSEIFGAGVEDDAHQGVFVDGTRIDAERTLALEEEADVAGAAHLAAVALE